MSRHRFFLGAGLALLVVCLSWASIQPTTASASGEVSNQHQGVPAYFYPNVKTTPDDWYRMCSSMNTNMGGSTAVMNPSSGPGSAWNTDYVNAVQYCQNHGQNVVGYVHTSYGNRPLSTVEAEVTKYYQWYHVDGIFVDEMSNDASTARYYHSLYQYIHNKGGTLADLVVGNPGAAASSDWQLSRRAADELVIFEDDASTYTSWTPPSWVSSYTADNFWNLVYNAPTRSSMQAVCRYSKTVNAGSMYVTYGTLPNPWGFLPSDSYWNSELTAC